MLALVAKLMLMWVQPTEIAKIRVFPGDDEEERIGFGSGSD